MVRAKQPSDHSGDGRPYRVADVAALLDVHPSTIYRDIAAGRLRALRVGSRKGAVRILPDDLKAYLALVEIRPEEGAE